MFLNGESIKTPALEARIDEISKSFSGFYFGRYDIRTPSLEAIKNDAGFKVVELNGVTSEATHIYDPQNSLLEGYRVLMKQWRMAFEIGALNCARNAMPVSAAHLLRLLLKKIENFCKILLLSWKKNAVLNNPHLSFNPSKRQEKPIKRRVDMAESNVVTKEDLQEVMAEMRQGIMAEMRQEIRQGLAETNQNVLALGTKSMSSSTKSMGSDTKSVLMSKNSRLFVPKHWPALM